MRVALVVPPNATAIDDRLEPHLGLLYIAAVLERAGHEAVYVDLEGVSEESWSLPEADAYGITVYGVTLGAARALARRAKALNPRALVVVGGPQVSGLPEKTLALEPAFDCAVVHEGEWAFLDALGDRGRRRIYRRPVEDIDALPLPARHLADLATYTRTVYGRPSLSLITQRGCPFDCHFCANDRLFGPLRQRSVPSVIAELEGLTRTYGCRSFYFHDNIISVNRPRFHRLLEGLAPLGIEWFAYDDCRGAHSVEEYRLWREAGCRVVFLGVESGSDRMLRLMNKRQTKEGIRRTIANMQEAGIEARCALLFGFPGETRETWAETVGLVEELQPAQVFVNYFVPFAGTAVEEDPERFGVTAIEPGFERHYLIDKDGLGAGTFSTAALGSADYQALAREASAWWKRYILEHPSPGAPAWTAKVLEMMGEGASRWSADSTAMEAPLLVARS